MKFVGVIFLLSALSLDLTAQDQPAPPAEPDITFPDVSPPSPPAPPPTPASTPIKLLPDTFYIITSNVPCMVVASPEGLVNVLEEKGPIRILGKFVEGKTQVRNYTKPYVFLVTAVDGASGVCELIVRAEGPKPGPVLRRKIEVGQGPRPPPVPPIPPQPPIPPAPPPGPAPIPLPGLRVLFVYESADLSKYPPGQLAVLYSKQVRDYLNAKCVVGSDGKTPERRIVDQNVIGLEPHWQEAMKRRTSLPWLVISNGTDGYEGPVPNSVDEAMTLLRKYGGN